jgi:hypothetical protein
VIKLGIDLLLSAMVAAAVTFLFDQVRPEGQRSIRSTMFALVMAVTLVVGAFVPLAFGPMIYWIPFLAVGMVVGAGVVLWKSRRALPSGGTPAASATLNDDIGPSSFDGNDLDDPSFDAPRRHEQAETRAALACVTAYGWIIALGLLAAAIINLVRTTP